MCESNRHLSAYFLVSKFPDNNNIEKYFPNFHYHFCFLNWLLCLPYQVDLLRRENKSMEKRLDSEKSNQGLYSRALDDVGIKMKAKDHTIERLQMQADSTVESVCGFSVWVIRSFMIP